MRKILATIIAATALATGTGMATAASAAPESTNQARYGCATRGDFYRIHKGQSLGTVQRILHQRGRYAQSGNEGSYYWHLRTFNGCGAGIVGNIIVGFMEGPGYRTATVTIRPRWV